MIVKDILLNQMHRFLSPPTLNHLPPLNPHVQGVVRKPAAFKQLRKPRKVKGGIVVNTFNR